MAGITWWTPERLAALRALLADPSMTYREAARSLSRRYRRRVTARAVTHVAQRLDIPPRATGRRRAT